MRYLGGRRPYYTGQYAVNCVPLARLQLSSLPAPFLVCFGAIKSFCG